MCAKMKIVKGTTGSMQAFVFLRANIKLHFMLKYHNMGAKS